LGLTKRGPIDVDDRIAGDDQPIGTPNAHVEHLPARMHARQLERRSSRLVHLLIFAYDNVDCHAQ
jgi:hypothetical protein